MILIKVLNCSSIIVEITKLLIKKPLRLIGTQPLRKRRLRTKEEEKLPSLKYQLYVVSTKEYCYLLHPWGFLLTPNLQEQGWFKPEESETRIQIAIITTISLSTSLHTIMLSMTTPIRKKKKF